jgi:hypothetical protein
MSVPTTSAQGRTKSAGSGSSSNSSSNSSAKATGNSSGIERRRRKRAKISAQVHVRAINSPEPFEEVCKSEDVSRDGLLFMSARAGYWKGQELGRAEHAAESGSGARGILGRRATRRRGAVLCGES